MTFGAEDETDPERQARAEQQAAEVERQLQQLLLDQFQRDRVPEGADENGAQQGRRRTIPGAFGDDISDEE